MSNAPDKPTSKSAQTGDLIDFLKRGNNLKILAASFEQDIAAMSEAQKREIFAQFGGGLKLGKDSLSSFGGPVTEVPITREAFDEMYAKADVISAGQGRQMITNVVRLSEVPDVVDTSANLLSAYIRKIVPSVSKVFSDAGMDVGEAFKKSATFYLGSADIDIEKLDQRLTDDERKTVQLIASISKALTDGRLKSTQEDAPESSPWAQRLKAVEAAGKGSKSVGG